MAASRVVWPVHSVASSRTALLWCDVLGVVPKKSGKFPLILHVSAPEGTSIDDGILHVSAPEGTSIDDGTSQDEFSLHYMTVESEHLVAQDSLKLNTQKIQLITVSKPDNSWRAVELLGSLLGTDEDVNSRIGTTNRAYATISWQRHHSNTSSLVSACSGYSLFQCCSAIAVCGR